MHVSDYQTNAGESSKRKILIFVLFRSFLFPVHKSAITGQLAQGLGTELCWTWVVINAVPRGFSPAKFETLFPIFTLTG